MLQAAIKEQPRMAPRSGASPLERPQTKSHHDLILPQMQLMKPRINCNDPRGSTCLLGSTVGSCLRPGDRNGLQIGPTRAFNGGWKASPPCTTQVGNVSTSSDLQGEDRHRCRPLHTSRCSTTYHRCNWGNHMLGSQKVPTPGNLSPSAPAYISPLQTGQTRSWCAFD